MKKKMVSEISQRVLMYTSIDVITKLFYAGSGFRKNAIFTIISPVTGFNAHRLMFVFQNIGCY